MPETMETRVRLLEVSDERRGEEIKDLKEAIGGVQRSINRALIAVSGLLFTTVINLLVALVKLGK